MTNTNSTNSSRTPRRLLVPLICAAALLVLAAIYLGSFLFIGDGTSSLTGVQKDIAQKAIKFEEKTAVNNAVSDPLQHISVVDVRELTNDEQTGKCSGAYVYSNDVNDLRHYAVHLEIRSPFKPKPMPLVAYGCVLMTFDSGYFQ